MIDYITECQDRIFEVKGRCDIRGGSPIGGSGTAEWFVSEQVWNCEAPEPEEAFELIRRLFARQD